ncbi:hypothetical protein BDV34DRAFT_199404 [Aspergillus parasiticus]|uniref:Uncharacterized protein n=1 Tax=Aspergillus parasiticus TaxID=5067 RepID=A0A5N6DEJ4_ASPPA|nr:hypothetical protein BDV34DRAFT_199404 [Aspergillus parasiticus]
MPYDSSCFHPRESIVGCTSLLPVIALANRNLSCSAYFAAMILLFSSFYRTRITASYDYIVMIQHSPDLPPVAPDLTSTVKREAESHGSQPSITDQIVY